MKLKRSAGILLHPTSLYGEYGIGDLGEVCFEFIDFLRESKQKIWQVLPLTPTSFGDSPYQSFSTFAGNVLLISPKILLEKKYLTNSDLNNIPNFDLHKIDYAKVIDFKTKLFKIAYHNFKKDSAAKKSFNKFCEKNADWLDDYALFVALKNYFIAQRKNDLDFDDANKKLLDELPNQMANDFYYGAVWITWPLDLKTRDKKTLDKWAKKLEDDIAYHKFLQFEFYNEWFAVKDYANNNDISIIGDIPIFVAFDSADVWANPDLFELDSDYFPSVVAGVPPDYFSQTGQLWGNPLYNWTANKNSDYKWWIKRIKNTCDCVDIIRIDHFRGFESYWAIKFGETTAINGKWCKGPGKNFFDFVEKKLGKLPIIAEDLGIITEEITNLRDACGFPGMKILQFAFDDGDENDHMPHNFQTSNIVAYTGTHDNDTVVGWYEKAPDSYKDKFRRYMNVSGNDPAWDLIRLLYASVAAFAIVPVQDLMGLNSDSRMNFPGVAAGNWQFRFTKEMLSAEIKNKLLYLCGLFQR